MKLDKKTDQALMKIFNGILLTKGDGVYSRIKKEGSNNNEVFSIELLEGQRQNEKRKNSIERIFNVKDEYKNKDFSFIHKNIVKIMEENESAIVRKKKMDSYFSLGILNKLKETVSETIGDQSNIVLLSDVKLLAVANTIEKARNAELMRSYLQLKDSSLMRPEIHVLAKGVKNVENPKKDLLMPEHVTNEIAMIQIGLALNELATKPLNRSKPVPAFERDLKVKKMAQSSGTNTSLFLSGCKSLARKWEQDNLIKLKPLLEKQEELRKTTSQKVKVDDTDLVKKVDSEKEVLDNTKNHREFIPKSKQSSSTSPTEAIEIKATNVNAQQVAGKRNRDHSKRSRPS